MAFLGKRLVLCLALLPVAVGAWSESNAQTRVMSKLIIFSHLSVGTRVPMFQMEGVRFEAHGTFEPVISDLGKHRERGYQFPGYGVSIIFPTEVSLIGMRICGQNQVMIETLDSAGSSMSNQPVIKKSHECGDVSIAGDRIATIRLSGGGNEATIVYLHYSWQQ